MTLILALMFGILADQQLVVRSYDPYATPNRSSRMTFNCPTFVIDATWTTQHDYTVRADVLMNHRPIAGNGAARLLRDLSDPRTVYRLAVVCAHPGEAFIHIKSALRDTNGVIYHSGQANIRDGRLTLYGGLDLSTESEFLNCGSSCQSAAIRSGHAASEHR
jgi:hypothetical protein